MITNYESDEYSWSSETVGENNLEEMEDISPDSSESANVEFDLTYDVAITATHSYLGEDLEEVRGNVLYDDNVILENFPLMIQTFVVLHPGQLFPMIVHDDPTKKMLRLCKKENRSVFGVISEVEPGVLSKYGVTAEILECKDEGHEMHIKSRGRQKFAVINVTRRSQVSYGKIWILPEIRAVHGFHDSRIAALDSHRTPVLDEKIQWKRRLQIERYDAAVTPWPAWVLKNVDPLYLQSKVKKQLSCLQKVTRMPDTPNEFSFWLGQNFPLEYHIRDELLHRSSATSRLFYYAKYFSKKRTINCKKCLTILAKFSSMFQMTPEGCQSIYANPAGVIFEAITLREVTNKVDTSHGLATKDYSWFPGYEWITVTCHICYTHLGWQFTTNEDGLKPKKFWAFLGKGICLATRHRKMITN